MEYNKTHRRVLALIAFIALLLAALLLPPLPKAKKVRASRIHQGVNTIANPFITVPGTNALPTATSNK